MLKMTVTQNKKKSTVDNGKASIVCNRTLPIVLFFTLKNVSQWPTFEKMVSEYFFLKIKKISWKFYTMIDIFLIMKRSQIIMKWNTVYEWQWHQIGTMH